MRLRGLHPLTGTAPFDLRDRGEPSDVPFGSALSKNAGSRAPLRAHGVPRGLMGLAPMGGGELWSLWEPAPEHKFNWVSYIVAARALKRCIL